MEKNPSQTYEIDLVPFFKEILDSKRTFVLFVLLGLFCAGIFFVISKPFYMSTCTILPGSAQNPSQSLVNSAQGLTSFLGIPAGAQSNAIEILLDSASFYEKFSSGDPKEIDGSELKDSIEMKNEKSGVLRLTCKREVENEAQELLMKVIEQLKIQLNDQKTEKVNSEVQFLKERVEEFEGKYRASEEKVKLFQEKYQGVGVEKQIEIMMDLLKKARSKQQMLETDLEMSLKSLSPNDDSVVKLKQSLETTQNEINRILKGGENHGENLGLIAYPGIGMEFSQLTRDMELNFKIYSQLLERFIMAKIDLQKTSDGFEVIDKPNKPKGKIKRSLLKLLAAGAFAGFVLAFLLIFLKYNVSIISRQVRLLQQ